MKNNQKKEVIFKLPNEVMKICGFDAVDALSIKSAEGVCVIHPSAMTVLEVAYAIDALSTLAADLTVVLAKAGGICDNCGQRDAAPNARSERLAEVIALRSRTNPAGGWRGHAGELVPPARRTVSGANSAIFAEIACAVESDCQHDLTDLPDGVLKVLIASGVCLAELDERIMLEEIVYGQ